MSKNKFLGSQIDKYFRLVQGRRPGFRVYLWNKNRTDIHEVVLGQATSPRYDVTNWVESISFTENAVFENNDDAVATRAQLVFVRDEGATPEITERTLLRNAPVQIWQGDEAVPVHQWVPVFTGIILGHPSFESEQDRSRVKQTIQVSAVDRAVLYSKKKVIARSYDKGQDVGKAVVETAIEVMDLDRREIEIGFQDYEIGHADTQLVDIRVLPGIHQMLFTTGKKPRFNYEGKLVAADTDLDKAPARIYEDFNLIKSVNRTEYATSVYNSIRLFGLDEVLTQVVEQEKRLAHGEITSGYFESAVHEEVFFSEDKGKSTGGRRAKNTRLVFKVASVGSVFGQNVTWSPVIEDDGYTVFSGLITFDTGHSSELRAGLIAHWGAMRVLISILHGTNELNINGPAIAWLESLAAAEMMAILYIMSELGSCRWEVYGQPFQNVFQQLCATAQLDGIPSSEIEEKSFRNDWLYDIEYMRTKAKELLKRELVKSHGYEIVMVDDPLLETDDVIQVGDNKFYITSIEKTLSRPFNGLMKLKTWRLS